MNELLQQAKDQNRTLSFLFPALTGTPVQGTIAELTDSVVAIICSVQGSEIRIFTHPNTVVLVER